MARNKPTRQEKTKLQSAIVIKSIKFCGFEVCSRDLNLIMNGQYTIVLSESNESVPGFLTRK